MRQIKKYFIAFLIPIFTILSINPIYGDETVIGPGVEPTVVIENKAYSITRFSIKYLNNLFTKVGTLDYVSDSDISKKVSLKTNNKEYDNKALYVKNDDENFYVVESEYQGQTVYDMLEDDDNE